MYYARTFLALDQKDLETFLRNAYSYILKLDIKVRLKICREVHKLKRKKNTRFLHSYGDYRRIKF